MLFIHELGLQMLKGISVNQVAPLIRFEAIT